jgi:hypothetical protein
MPQPRTAGGSSGAGEVLAALVFVVVLLIAANQFLGPWVDLGGLFSEAAEKAVSADAGASPPGGVPPGDAKAIVEAAVAIAGATGLCSEPGPPVCVASAFRPGAVTENGPSDHAWNDANRAARDIAVRGINALKGPPSPLLDDAAVAIGAAFGKQYAHGRVIAADNFDWHGYRVQIIWRTPKYGGHMGHIHIGACRGCPV